MARPRTCPHTPVRGAPSVPTQNSGRGRPSACPRTPSHAPSPPPSNLRYGQATHLPSHSRTRRLLRPHPALVHPHRAGTCPPQTSGWPGHAPAVRGASSVPTQNSGRGRPSACPRTPSHGLHLPPQTSGMARPRTCPHTPVRGAPSVPTQNSGRGRPSACPRTPSRRLHLPPQTSGTRPRTCPHTPVRGASSVPTQNSGRGRQNLRYGQATGLVPALVHPHTPPSPPPSNLRYGQATHLPSHSHTRRPLRPHPELR